MGAKTQPHLLNSMTVDELIELEAKHINHVDLVEAVRKKLMEECQHVWRFQHVVYWSGGQRYGSSARDRIIGDKYYCEKCLYTAVQNQRAFGTDYDKPPEGVFPR